VQSADGTKDGWAFFTHLYAAARNSNYSFGLDDAKRDFFYRELCTYTGRDYARFCAAWGIRVSALARSEMAEKYPPMDRSIWLYDPYRYTGGDEPLSSRYDLDRSDWKATASSVGTDGQDGPAARVLDGNAATFAMTSPTGPLPQFYEIDMGANQIVKGFSIQNRAAGTNIPKSMKISVRSEDGNWQELANTDFVNPPVSGLRLEVPNVRTPIEYTLKNGKNIRYFRYTFDENNRNLTPSSFFCRQGR